MSREPDVLPKITITAEQELKVLRTWRDGERSVSNLVKRTRVKSDQIWAVLHKYGVKGTLRP